MTIHILVVDDEPQILHALETTLRGAGYEIETAATGEDALTKAKVRSPDGVILDLVLPGISGVEVCRELRVWSDAAVLVLSVVGDEAEKVAALDAGADDYVTKPFGAEELLARIRAALRRSDSTFGSAGPIVRGGLTIDRERFRVMRDGEEVRLTPKEFELLSYLAQHPGRVLTHRAILKAIWGPHATDQPEHLRVLVGSLRKKIEPNPSSPKYILTEPWVGYRFADLS